MNIYRYLININKGLAFNAQRLHKLLEEHDLSLDELGTLLHVNENKYKLYNIDTDLLNKLIIQFTPPTSRQDASKRLSDSHSYRTKTSYCVAKLNSSNAQDFVIKCDGDFSLKGFESSDDVILIENSECYTYSETFLSAVGLDGISLNTIVIWSSGNAISHPASLAMLSCFNNIYYCPDYDLGGIQIYETLHRHLNGNVIFVMPENLVDYAKYCKPPKRLDLFNKALSKAREHGFQPMVDLLVNGKGVLEQEVLIGGLDD